MNSQWRAAFAAVVFVFASLAAPAAQATKDNSYFNTHGLGYVQTGNQVRGDSGKHVLLGFGGPMCGRVERIYGCAFVSARALPDDAFLHGVRA
jgi:hypothetical protein